MIPNLLLLSFAQALQKIIANLCNNQLTLSDNESRP